jgi:protein-disulfide isomerase
MSTRRARKTGRGNARRRTLFIGAGIAVLALVALFFLLRPGVGGAPSVGGAPLASSDPDIAAAAYTAPVRGLADAPVTIVEYGDFQCPSCGAFARSTAPELIRRYVDTGKAKIIWKNFPWIGGESKLAAQAAACAGAQGRFWEYHDYLFAHQRGENAGAFSVANLKSFATALTLDRPSFDACLDSGRYRAVVEKDASEVRALGLTGTPTFIINGTRVVGAQPIEVLAKVIDGKLAGQ